MYDQSVSEYSAIPVYQPTVPLQRPLSSAVYPLLHVHTVFVWHAAFVGQFVAGSVHPVATPLAFTETEEIDFIPFLFVTFLQENRFQTINNLNLINGRLVCLSVNLSHFVFAFIIIDIIIISFIIIFL